ncbi:hypothetical protein LAX5112_04743 [Roseibium alexandrii]|uniref:Uncharacterized protein n=1 Tax=Roseibium alexandrii TaxID=388408 RepID=A0A0M7AQW5_9HYPH|nr:hypothetical protein LAX5112_04743 [Roseibium alexandrii]
MGIQLFQTAFQFGLDRLGCLLQRRFRRHIVRVGVDLHRLHVAGFLARQRVELGDLLDLVAEQRNPPRPVLIVRRKEFNCVPADAKSAALERGVVAFVLQGDQIGDQLALVDPLSDLDGEGHRRVGLDRADTVDAGDGGDDDDVVTLQQRAGGRVAHPVDLLVDRAFLLDIGVGTRDVGLRLVIVVVGDEILDRIVREETLELAIKLGRQRLVRRQDQRRALGALDDLRHGVGLARAGDPEQHLGLLAGRDATHKFGNRGRLVALRLVLGGQVDRDAAFGFFWPVRPVWHPEFAILVQRVAAFDQGRQGLDGRGCALLAAQLAIAAIGGGFLFVVFLVLFELGLEFLGLLQRHVQPGHGIKTPGSPLARRVRLAHTGSARGFGWFLLFCARGRTGLAA